MESFVEMWNQLCWFLACLLIYCLTGWWLG
jgi:hypothetical protein